MGDMLIRGIPEGLKNEIAEAARGRGQSLSAKAVDLLRKGLIVEREDRPHRSAWDEIRSAFESAMIAAICLIHGATLATRNVRDFDGLDLKLVNPFEQGA